MSRKRIRSRSAFPKANKPESVNSDKKHKAWKSKCIPIAKFRAIANTIAQTAVTNPQCFPEHQAPMLRKISITDLLGI
jgi:hypothetical protein